MTAALRYGNLGSGGIVVTSVSRASARATIACGHAADVAAAVGITRIVAGSQTCTR